MSDQNIIPSERKEASASATSVAEPASAPPLYPTLPDASEATSEAASFRLKKICDCQKELENEISHYRKVSKKYKRANSIAHTSSTLTGVMAAVLSSTGLAVSLSGIGVIAGAPLAGIAGLLGFLSTTMTISSKKLNKKITKHEKTVSLAESSQLSISKLISKALNDGQISDAEFNFILREVEQYHSLMNGLRKEMTSEGVDIEAIKQQRKNEYQKKLGSLVNIRK